MDGYDTVQVRPAGPHDTEDVVRIRIRSWRHAYAGIMPDSVLAALDHDTDERVRRARERWADPAWRVFSTQVATDSGGTLGFVTYGPYRIEDGPDGQVDPETGEVLAIYVDPHHHGRGAGRALMDTAVAALRERGVAEVRLWVLEENTPARRFYERYGFAADGERHFFQVQPPDGAPVDLPEVRYALRL
jgi:ribosomal protein S18 acetylase RimI-like enzyme